MAVTRADLGSCLVSLSFSFRVCIGQAPHSPDDGGRDRPGCVEMQVAPLHLRGSGGMLAPAQEKSGSLLHTGGGLEGLAHMADEKLPDF